MEEIEPVKLTVSEGEASEITEMAAAAETIEKQAKAAGRWNRRVYAHLPQAILL